MEDFVTQVLLYHALPSAGKMKTVPAKRLCNQKDLAMAYSPGVAHACMEIFKDPSKANDLTIRQSLVAVISNGTSVLGLGDIGALASKPVMEGKSVLFQLFGKLNSVSIEIDEKDPEKLIQTISSLEPMLGGINLEDIKAPECFVIEEALCSKMNIPVFHDDQHGTAIVVSTAILNALSLVNKRIEDVQCVVSGAGAGALACLNLLVSLGLPIENILVCDSKGVIHFERDDLNQYKKPYARVTEKRTLSQALEGADVFIGLSRKGLLNAEAIQKMNQNPIVLALANPDPEILPHEALAVRPDVLIGTGRSDYPNQVNNLLCFPYIFRGALDAKVRQITKEMKVAFVKELQKITKEGFSDLDENYGGLHAEFGTSYFVPKPFDKRLLERLPLAVAKAAVECGVAEKGFCLKTYAHQLIDLAYEDLPAFKVLRKSSRPLKPVYVFLEKGHPLNQKVISAVKALMRFDLLDIYLVGDALEIKELIDNNKELAPLPLKPYQFAKQVDLENNCCVFTKNSFQTDFNGQRFLGYALEGSYLFLLEESGCSKTDLYNQERAFQAIQEMGFVPSFFSDDLSQRIEKKQGFLKMVCLKSLQDCHAMVEKFCAAVGPFYLSSFSWQFLQETETSLHAIIEKICFCAVQSKMA